MGIVSTKGRCPPGEAVITTAGNLPCKKVIHTVGPVYNDGKNDEANVLANCYKNSLQLAYDNNLRSVAFPNISTGVYGYPKREAAKVAVEAVNGFVSTRPGFFAQIIFVCFDEENYKIYRQLLPD